LPLAFPFTALRLPGINAPDAESRCAGDGANNAMESLQFLAMDQIWLRKPRRVASTPLKVFSKKVRRVKVKLKALSCIVKNNRL